MLQTPVLRLSLRAIAKPSNLKPPTEPPAIPIPPKLPDSQAVNGDLVMTKTCGNKSGASSIIQPLKATSTLISRPKLMDNTSWGQTKPTSLALTAPTIHTPSTMAWGAQMERNHPIALT